MAGSLNPNQKIKSDPQNHENKQTPVNKYIESLICNSIKAGQRIGQCGGTPEGRSEFIDIS